MGGEKILYTEGKNGFKGSVKEECRKKTTEIKGRERDVELKKRMESR